MKIFENVVRMSHLCLTNVLSLIVEPCANRVRTTVEALSNACRTRRCLNCRGIRSNRKLTAKTQRTVLLRAPRLMKGNNYHKNSHLISAYYLL